MSKLAQYLKSERMTQREFARRIGVTGAQINRYIKGVNRPTWRTMPHIEAETEGFVTYRDFLDAPVNGPLKPSY